MKDLFKNIKTFIDRKRGKQAEENVDDEAEFDGDDSDKNPGKVSMNGGSHGTVFGINRKIITAVLVGGFLVIGMATVFNLTGHKEKEQAKPQQQTQETAANAEGVMRNDKNAVGSYEQLLDPKRQPNGKPGSHPNNSGNAEAKGQNDPNANNPNAAQQVQPVRANMPVPAIPQAPYSAPVTLPSQVNAKTAAQTAEEREAAQAKKSLEDRFKSAIDFALGRNSGNNTSSGEVAANAPAGGQTMAMNGGQGSSNLVQVGYTAPSDTILQAGTVIPAMLYSGINTDTPGQITAEVQADVYDSATGTRLLIPAGSTLVGSYEQGDSASTGRVSLVFTTLVMADGGSFNLGDSFVAMDMSGYNGLHGKVNHHTGSKIGGGMFASALAALGSYASGNVSTQNTYSGGQLAMQGALANLMQTASSLFKKGMDKQNTVTIAPGQQFNIFVTKPVSFGY